MGNIFDRSSTGRSGKSKMKVKKRKQKQLQQMGTSMDEEKYIIENEDDVKNPPENSYDKQEEWMQRIEQHQLSNVNVDPPGAPRTHSTNYPIVQGDVMTRSWSAAMDLDNSFYPNTSLPMATSIHPQIPPQYNYDYTYIPQPASIPAEERPSKKVQFARPIEQKISSNIPLTATNSWHEPSLTNTHEITNVSGRQESSLSKSFLHQSTVPTKTNTSMSSAASVQKPIYVSIDHRATLAERGQTKADKRHHKNTEKSTSTAGSHHRSRGHGQLPNKHQESIDSSSSKHSASTNRSVESVPHRTSTTTSTSTIPANRQMQSTELPSIQENQMKRPRHIHQPQNQYNEQQSAMENDPKLFGTRTNSSQTKQHSRSNTNRNTSPGRNEVIRRVEIRQPIASAASIPLSQPQSRSKSSHQVVASNNITRTRI